MTPTGCDVLTRFPAQELLVAGRMYVRGADLLPSAGGGQDGFADRVAATTVVDPAGVPA